MPKYLGVHKFRCGRPEEKDEIGLCNGLAVTMHGGDLLAVGGHGHAGQGQAGADRQARRRHAGVGAGGDELRPLARASRSGLDRDFYSKVDIHVHFPEGAIPKDGPSAGITMATALVSALLRIPVRRDVAMTGEITLRGRVLPIGGLKEKILAAHRADIFTVIIPKENRKDLKDIPKRVLKVMKIIAGRAHGRGAARGAADRESGDVPARAEPGGRLARGGSRGRRWRARRADDDAGTDGAATPAPTVPEPAQPTRTENQKKHQQGDQRDQGELKQFWFFSLISPISL